MALNEIPVIQRFIAIIWPSFLTAGIATIFFTTAFDPEVIFIDYDVTRLGVYSMAFFIFWLFGAITSMATCFFLRPCAGIKKSDDE